MTQTYTGSVALGRMRMNRCPECGRSIEEHGGCGGPGCSLTDGGVADRIAHQRLIDATTEPGR